MNNISIPIEEYERLKELERMLRSINTNEAYTNLIDTVEHLASFNDGWE